MTLRPLCWDFKPSHANMGTASVISYVTLVYTGSLDIMEVDDG